MRVEVDAVLAQRTRLVRAASRASVGGSLLMHLVIVGVCALAPLLTAQKSAAVPEFVPIVVVPAQALGVAEPTPAPRRVQPTPPEPEPEPETPQPVVDEAKPEPALPSPERRRPEPQETRPLPKPSAAGDLGRRRGSPTGSTTGTSPFGGGPDVSFADQNFTYSYYIDQMLALIQSQWQRPRLGAQVEAAVFFRIHRDGRITDLRVIESSGFNVFDLAGLRAVQQAAPFPKLPVSYPRNELAVKLILR